MENNFQFSFDSSKSSNELYSILSDMRQWWVGLHNEEFEGVSNMLGEEITYRAGNGAHYSRHKLTEAIPYKQLSWLTTDSALSFLENKDEWTGTVLSFRLEIIHNGTRVTFNHFGLVPQIACYNRCVGAWGRYMQKLATELK